MIGWLKKNNLVLSFFFLEGVSGYTISRCWKNPHTYSEGKPPTGPTRSLARTLRISSDEKKEKSNPTRRGMRRTRAVKLILSRTHCESAHTHAHNVNILGEKWTIQLPITRKKTYTRFDIVLENGRTRKKSEPQSTYYGRREEKKRFPHAIILSVQRMLATCFSNLKQPSSRGWLIIPDRTR